MKHLIQAVKLSGLALFLAQATSAEARIVTAELNCTELRPAGRIGNFHSLSGMLRIRMGSTSATLELVKGGSSRPLRVQVATLGSTMSEEGFGIRNIDKPVAIQLINDNESAETQEALKLFGAESLVLNAVVGNARGDLDAAAEGESLLTLASAEQISENTGTNIRMTCTLKL